MAKQDARWRTYFQRVFARALVAFAGAAVATGMVACDQASPAAIAPMELQGRWQGMRLSEVGSETARTLGVPADVTGVVVAEVVQANDSRAFWAGLQPGDLLVSINGSTVESLTDLYAVTDSLGEPTPVPIEFMRRGQQMSAMLNPAPSLQAGPPGAMEYYCPVDQVRWSAAQVAPSFRCPRCNGPLSR